MLKVLLVILLLQVVFSQSIFSYFFADKSTQQKALQIESKYNHLVALGNQQGRYSDCWRNAINSMKDGCAGLKDDDNQRSKLAVHFTNCHLQKSGLTPYPCTEDMSVQQCTSPMVTSSIAFTAYTEFTSHVDNICFYIQSEEFSHKIENNIQDLITNSGKASHLLDQVASKSSSIERSVENSVLGQEKLIKEQDLLNNQLLKIKEEESYHFKKLSETFNSIHMLSNMMKTDITKLNQDQKSILSEQEKMKNIAEYHLKEIEKMKVTFKELSEESKSISSSQSELKDSVSGIGKTQEYINTMMSSSLEKQDSLVLGQNELKSKQIELASFTEKVMKDIEVISADTLQKMHETIKNQEKLIEFQKISDEQLSKLSKHQEDNFDKAKRNLDDLLLYSHEQTNRIKQHHNEFTQHSKHLFETISHIIELHNSLIGEFMNIESIVYYVSCVILAFLLTTTSWTNQARIFLFVALSMNFLTERLLVKMLIGSYNSEYIHGRLWLCRKVFVFLYVLIIGVSAFLYTNYEKINYGILKQVQSELGNLRQEWKQVKSRSWDQDYEDEEIDRRQLYLQKFRDSLIIKYEK